MNKNGFKTTLFCTFKLYFYKFFIKQVDLNASNLLTSLWIEKNDLQLKI